MNLFAIVVQFTLVGRQASKQAGWWRAGECEISMYIKTIKRSSSSAKYAMHAASSSADQWFSTKDILDKNELSSHNWAFYRR